MHENIFEHMYISFKIEALFLDKKKHMYEFSNLVN